MGYASPTLQKMTVEEYLAWEPLQQERHEFYDGEIFAMAGGTYEHNSISGAVYSALRTHLKGTPCRVAIADIRIKVNQQYFYPDVSVTCATSDVQTIKANEFTAPKLIVEVLSASTAAYDRGLKFANYRQLSSLQEYLLIDPETKTAELFRKNALGIWELHPSDAAQPMVHLTSIGLSSHLDTVFE